MEQLWNTAGGELLLVLDDITRARVDAVVNAANSRLAGGGGVDGAIHRAAGPNLLRACQEIVHAQGELPAGQAVITPAFNMKAKFVIHTVGPIWQGGTHNEEATLRSAYEQCFARAHENNLSTIAFPAISCGAYGYPPKLAAPVAIKAIKQALKNSSVRSVAMYVFSKNGFRTWQEHADNALK